MRNGLAKVVLVLCTILATLALMWNASCAQAPIDVERIRQLAALALQATGVAGDAAIIKGGEGDSATGMMYALIAAVALLYPVVVRPIRKKWFDPP